MKVKSKFRMMFMGAREGLENENVRLLPSIPNWCTESQSLLVYQ